MANINSPRYQQWFVQLQTTLLAFNNTTGVWTNTGAKLLRVDANSVSINRNAPYNRFPVLTGARSEVAGLRGRKLASWSIRGLPFIPSGTAGTVPDFDAILQNIFGGPSTIAAGVSCSYAFVDSGYLPLSLLGFNASSTAFTQQALWGAFVTRVTVNFNQNFLTMDLEGFCGYNLDSTGFSIFDSQAKAGLTAFPLKPSSPTTAGAPIAGYGNGYTCTIHSQSIELKVQALSMSIETGFVPITDVYGTPYLAAVVGDARRISLNLGQVLDDDSAALNDIKTQADTDNVTINAVITAGNVAGSIATFNVNNIQPNSFNLRDNGPEVSMEIPASYAHASAAGLVNDMTLVLT